MVPTRSPVESVVAQQDKGEVSEMTGGDESTSMSRRSPRASKPPASYDPATGRNVSKKTDHLLVREHIVYMDKSGKSAVSSELYHSDIDDELPTEQEIAEFQQELCGQTIPNDHFFDAWQRLQETKTDFASNPNERDKVLHFEKDDRLAVAAAKAKNASQEAERVFGIFAGLNHPSENVSMEMMMKRCQLFHDGNGIIQNMLKFLYSYIKILENKDTKKLLAGGTGVSRSIEKHRKSEVARLEKDRTLAGFRHLEYCFDPYILVDSSITAPLYTMWAPEGPARGRDFWKFICRHPQLFEQYKLHRQIVQGKSFAEDEALYKQQQEIHESSSRKRIREEEGEDEGSKKPRARNLSEDDAPYKDKSAAPGELFLARKMICTLSCACCFSCLTAVEPYSLSVVLYTDLLQPSQQIALLANPAPAPATDPAHPMMRIAKAMIWETS